MAGSPSYAARWAFTTVGGSYTAAPTFDFITDTVIKTAPILHSAGLLGFRARQRRRSRQGSYSVGGTLTHNPSPAAMSYFLQWGMGGGSATVPAFANALALRDVLFDRTGDIYEGSGFALSRWTLSGRSGQLLEASLDLVGKTMTGGQAFTGPAALGATLANQPFQHADVVLTLGNNVQRQVEDFSLIIDNGATPKWRNSLPATEITPATHRVCQVTATSIFTADEAVDILDLNGEPDTGASLSITFGTVSATFTFANAIFVERSPTPQGDEFLIPMEVDLVGDSSGNEFTVLLDITP